MTVPRWSIVALSLMLASAAALPARAQPQPPQQGTSRAIELGRDGKAAFDRGDWKGAREAFWKAEQIAHSPVFVLYMARATEKLGDLVSAHNDYTRVANEQLNDNVPEPWRKAREEAAAELAALERRIPTIAIVIRGEGPSEARVLFDGAVVAPSALGTSIRTNPGRHTIEVIPKVGATIVRSVDLVEGAPQHAVTIDLPPPPPAKPLETPAKVFDPPAKPLEPPPPRPSPTLKQSTIGLILAASGGGVAALGILFGGVSLAAASGIKDRCRAAFPDTGGALVCPPEERDKIESTQKFATASWVILGTGAALAAVGLPLMVVQPKSKTTARLSVGPGSMWINGSF